MDFKGLMSKAGKAFGEEVDKKAKEMIIYMKHAITILI